MNFGQRLPGSTIELYMTESSTNTRQTDIYNALRLHAAETLISFGDWEETASDTASGKKKNTDPLKRLMSLNHEIILTKRTRQLYILIPGNFFFNISFIND